MPFLIVRVIAVMGRLLALRGEVRFVLPRYCVTLKQANLVFPVGFHAYACVVSANVISIQDNYGGLKLFLSWF